jgi:hypothetical protein
MGTGLEDTTAAELRARILAEGLEVTASSIGLNTTTLLRAAVGLPLHNATRQLIEGKLQHGECGSH